MNEEKTRLYLTRHGEVVNHGVYNGQTDVEITPVGVRQMERLRDLLQDKPLKAVYSSDLQIDQPAEQHAEPVQYRFRGRRANASKRITIQ